MRRKASHKKQKAIKDVAHPSAVGSPANDPKKPSNEPGTESATALPIAVVEAKKGTPSWLPIIISAAALCVSLFTLSFNLGLIRPHEDHDVVARVLGVSALTKGFSSIQTNGEISLKLALINRGNQTEIIRETFLCYSETKELDQRSRTWRNFEPQQIVQLSKGEKRLLHITAPFSSMNTDKRLWLGIGVKAVAPNADDIEVVWPVCEINLPSDGNGAWLSYNKDQTPLVQVISNKRLPHQLQASDDF